jgi:alkylated DNA repair dioxygenase AlkB
MKRIVEVEPGNQLFYYPDYVKNAQQEFEEATKGLSFSAEIVTMFQKSSVIKRRTVDYGLEYNYNKTAKRSIPWEPVGLKYQAQLTKDFGISWSQCACNEYVDQQAYIGPHHDHATQVGDEIRWPLWIASISLGAMRPMALVPEAAKDALGRNSKGQKNQFPADLSALSKLPGVQLIDLEPGSLIVFSNRFNHTWYHAIPRIKPATGMRISLTYRHF